MTLTLEVKSNDKAACERIVSRTQEAERLRIAARDRRTRIDRQITDRRAERRRLQSELDTLPFRRPMPQRSRRPGTPQTFTDLTTGVTIGTNAELSARRRELQDEIRDLDQQIASDESDLQAAEVGFER